MKLVNNVNELDGKNWLKNSINFYEFDNFNIENIQRKFYNYCYKKRTTGKTYLNGNKYLLDKYDFSFQYLKNIKSISKVFDLICGSSYNSYHIILVDNVVDANGILISKGITEKIEEIGLEYRGKIVIRCIEDNIIKQAFMILNRINSDEREKNVNIEKYKINVNLEKEYVINSKSKIDKIGLKHPAPYSYNDITTLVEIENINNKVILDPFLGVGSTILGTYKNNYNIGIELNKEYIDLIDERIKFLGISDIDRDKYKIINGDSLKEIKKLKKNIDIVITSPPYFNILKNKSKGVRHDNSQSRQGVKYYSENSNDIGNLREYKDYLESMKHIFKDTYSIMNNGGRFYLIISDFTINKKETDVHSDMIIKMNEVGYTYIGTSYILQNQKAIYPFGYPYKLVLNHIYQYVIIFEKR